MGQRADVRLKVENVLAPQYCYALSNPLRAPVLDFTNRLCRDASPRTIDNPSFPRYNPRGCVSGCLFDTFWEINIVPRSDKLIREWKILQMLEASRFGKTLSELAESACEEVGEAHLSERTVRRDIEALQLAGFWIDSHRYPGRGVVIGAGKNIPMSIAF
jgi:hypothetical protein